MPSCKKLLNKASLLTATGKKIEARKLLYSVLENDLQNGKALLLYLDTFETRAERAQGLERLFRKQNPANGNAD